MNVVVLRLGPRVAEQVREAIDERTRKLTLDAAINCSGKEKEDAHALRRVSIDIERQLSTKTVRVEVVGEVRNDGSTPPAE